ncbi:uncharacterized protein LOC125036594 [Penaeus chinensis]|uniref:uncharacterized protein LOC125036594 n=1 Tax=Penaeus chinensis TaxID=139456 RepID=UPI001FB75026|nr:uncharacterized protein LOC125036594 [Penaeus chinensis]
MGTCYLLLCLLAVTAGQEGKWRSVNFVTEDVFSEGELEKFALDFQKKLKDDLEALKQEMYIEFLGILQQFEDSRESLSQEVTSKLDEQITNILSKFGKVMRYSSRQIDLVSSKIHSLLGSVGSDSSDPLDPLVASEGGLEAYGDRRRRGAAPGVPTEADKELNKPLEEVIDAKTLSDFDTTNIPAEEERKLTEIISVSDYFDGHIESRDSDFVLWRQPSPGSPTQYIVPLHRAQKKVVHPAKNLAKNNGPPRNCYDLLKAGSTRDGVYKIFPKGAGEGVEVWCDQTSEGGGWTQVLRRQLSRPDQKDLNFTRSAEDYIRGFGSPSEEYWLGLENMHHLTTSSVSALRVSLVDSRLQSSSAMYNTFRVDGQDDGYRLQVADFDASSTAEDALTPHSAASFAFPVVGGNSTSADEKCSSTYGVGWWYLGAPRCYNALPTGTRRLQEVSAANLGNDLGTSKKGLLVWRSAQEEETQEEDHTLTGLVMAVRPVLQ